MVVSTFIMNRRCSYMQWHCRNRHLLYGTDTQNAHMPIHRQRVHYTICTNTQMLRSFRPNWYAFWAESGAVSLSNKKAIPTNSTNNNNMYVCFSFTRNIVSSKRHSERTNRIRTKVRDHEWLSVYECVVCMWFIWFGVAVCATGIR